jgi:hypothetical protein
VIASVNTYYFSYFPIREFPAVKNKFPENLQTQKRVFVSREDKSRYLQLDKHPDDVGTNSGDYFLRA